MESKVPRKVLVIAVEEVFFQCAKAIVRSKPWDPAIQVNRKTLFSTGKILAGIGAGKVGGDEFHRNAPDRLKEAI